MKVFSRAIVAATVAATLATCGFHPDNSKKYIFDGRVYDGVTGAALTKYTLQLQYADVTVNATVDKDGRYVVGYLPALQDFTIVVTASGYRQFLSNNAQLSDTTFANGKSAAGSDVSTSAVNAASDKRTINAPESLYFDAYVFPTATAAPDTNFTFTLSDSNNVPSGTLRLTPTVAGATAPAGASSLTDNTTLALGGGTTPQVWGNNADLQSATVVLPFTGGKVTVPGSKLTYGVSYSVDVFGVAGYEVSLGSTTVAIGTQAEVVISLSPDTLSTLLLVYCNTTDPTAIIPDATIKCFFNQPVALDPSLTAAAAAQLISVTATYFDKNTATSTTGLAPTAPVPTLTLTINGSDEVDIGGAGSLGIGAGPGQFNLPDTANDVITSYTYTIPATISIDPVTRTGTTASSVLSSLVTATTITVAAQPPHN